MSWYHPGQGQRAPPPTNGGGWQPHQSQMQTMHQQNQSVVSQATVDPNYAGGVNPGADPHWMTADNHHPHPGGGWWMRHDKIRKLVLLSGLWFILGNFHHKFLWPAVWTGIKAVGRFLGLG